MELLQKGRKGVLVFRPGVEEVEETAKAICANAKRILAEAARKMAAEAGFSAFLPQEQEELVQLAQKETGLYGLEVSTIYGEMDSADRKKAVRANPNGAKVLVGTNVIESGANIPWLDAGVSCGTGKQLTATENGGICLELIDLPQWRLTQQEGRVKRFRDGIFVLCSRTAWNDRPMETQPEIKRLPLTRLVMRCAALKLRAAELSFDYVPSDSQIETAELKLQRLGLLSQRYKLTNAGQFASRLPVSPETGAMLWHAREIGVLGAMIPLAAIMETGGIRKDQRVPHCLNTDSDHLDGLAAYQEIEKVEGNKARNARMEELNISPKRFYDAKDRMRELRQRCKGGQQVEATATQLRQCVLAGMLDNLFSVAGESAIKVESRSSFDIGRGSAYGFDSEFVVGILRTIKPKNGGRAFTVIERVTAIDAGDLQAVREVRPEAFAVEEETIPLENANGFLLKQTLRLFEFSSPLVVTTREIALVVSQDISPELEENNIADHG